MTPRPFYRWKSFWLGLCVLVFLGWAWVHSMSITNSVVYNRIASGDIYGFICSGGVVAFVRGGESYATPDGFTMNSGSIIHAEWLPSAYARIVYASPYGFELHSDSIIPAELQPLAHGRSRFPHESVMSVAYWFLILLFCLIWSAGLFWHWKREQKKSAFLQKP